MTSRKGDKGQGRRINGQARGKKARARGKHQPGILESWEDFDKDAMTEYLDAVEKEFNEQLDAFERALRCEN